MPASPAQDCRRSDTQGSCCRVINAPQDSIGLECMCVPVRIVPVGKPRPSLSKRLYSSYVLWPIASTDTIIALTSRECRRRDGRTLPAIRLVFVVRRNFCQTPPYLRLDHKRRHPCVPPRTLADTQACCMSADAKWSSSLLGWCGPANRHKVGSRTDSAAHAGVLIAPSVALRPRVACVRR
jgi:hypothetical protein